MRSLPLSKKLKAVREVVERGQSMLNISRKYGCSRQSLYQWVKTYQSEELLAKSVGNKKFSPDKIFSPKYRKGSSHPKSLHRRLEKKILEICSKDPGLSIRGIVRVLAKENLKVSTHGVYNVLFRRGLTTYDLRLKYAELHPQGGTLAPTIAPVQRAKIVEEFLIEKKSISEICRLWKISRPTFYEWLKRYQNVTKDKEMSVVDALTRRYKKGYENPRSTTGSVRDTVLGLVRDNPELSVHKIYAQVSSAVGRVVGHHGIQNILSREGLSTLAKRLVFATGFGSGEKLEVAPLYKPQIPVYSWRQLIPVIKSIPKLIVTSPNAGILKVAMFVVPFFVSILWVRMLFGTANVSPVGLFFASIALFFGFFFLVYSMKYYLSIFAVLRLAQSGSMTEGEAA